MSAAPTLVVTDLDGTLVTSAERVSPRARAVINRLVDVGVTFIPASGRPARWMLPVIEQIGLRPMCVCANGAVVYDSATDRITYAAELAPSVLAQVTDLVLDATTAALAERGLPPVTFAVERTGHSAFDRAAELFSVQPEFPHAWDTEEHSVQPLDELCASPAVKLLVRHDGVGSAELFDMVDPVIDAQTAHVTWSFSGGLLEINVPGVSKLSGLAHALDGVGPVPSHDPSGVVAFGDMPNDIAMLQWAGLGVAMGNAVEEVTSIADYRTAGHDDDGVADVLERWF